MENHNLQDIAESLKKIADAMYITKQDGSKVSIAQMVNSIGYNLKQNNTTPSSHINKW